MTLSQSLQRGCTWQSLFLSQRWFPKDHWCTLQPDPFSSQALWVMQKVTFVPNNRSLSEGEGGERCPLALFLQSRRLWLQFCNSRWHEASLRLQHWWGTRWWLTHNPRTDTLIKALQQLFIDPWDQKNQDLRSFSKPCSGGRTALGLLISGMKNVIMDNDNSRCNPSKKPFCVSWLVPVP